MLYFQIKELYPDISDRDFMLQDDSNGKGAYIKEWKSAYSKPTQAELDGVKDVAILKEKLREIRAKRNFLLHESDWTQLSDATLTQAQKDEWKIYRQKLKNIPQDFIATGEIVYPTKPNEEKV